MSERPWIIYALDDNESQSDHENFTDLKYFPGFFLWMYSDVPIGNFKYDYVIKSLSKGFQKHLDKLTLDLKPGFCYDYDGEAKKHYPLKKASQAKAVYQETTLDLDKDISLTIKAWETDGFPLKIQDWTDEINYVGTIHYKGQQLNMTEICVYNYESEARDEYYKHMRCGTENIYVSDFFWELRKVLKIKKISQGGRSLYFCNIERQGAYGHCSPVNYSSLMLFDLEEMVGLIFRHHDIYSVY